MRPKFSVIVPIYNVSRYLDKCINSMLTQTYRDYELILVDDGSTDDSGIICDRFAEKDDRIRVIHKKNGGLSDARNAGLEVAQGEYYYFLDGDDAVSEQLLEKTLTVLEETHVDMVVFGYEKVLDIGKIIGSVSFQNREYPIKDGSQKFDYFVHVLLQYYQGWEAWNRVYKGDIIRQNNLRFVDNDKIFAEDLLFLMMYLLHAESILGMEEKLYYYLTREESIMDVKSKRYNAKPIEALAECFYDYAQKVNPGEAFLNNYHLILGMLLYNEGAKKNEDVIEAGLQTIRDKAFVRKGIADIFRDAKKIQKEFGTDYTQKLLGFCGKLYGDVWQYKPGIVKRAYQKLVVRGLLPYVKYWRKYRNIFLIGSEDAGNLGDHQIAVSMREFFTCYFPKCRVIEIPASNYQYQLEEVAKYIRKRDWICTPGGGNLGDVYPYSEQIRRDVIKRFPHNKIVVFPQTIFFSDTENGSKEKAITKQIYSAHKKLKLLTRDAKSFERAGAIYDGEKALVPDIVLFSEYLPKNGQKRNGALLCLRTDRESCLSKEQKQDIEKIADQYTDGYAYIDHQYAYDIPMEQRQKYLDTVMKQYQSAELVVTDRLHGMIFAAITGTPCVVLDNYNQKVSGVYQWVKDLPYLRLCSKMEDMEALVKQLVTCKEFDTTAFRAQMDVEFKRLAEIIRK